MLVSKLHRFVSATAFTAALLALLVRTAPAQIANQSDISGLSLTGSGVVSSLFTVQVGSALRVPTFLTPSIADAFMQAAALISAQLRSQTYATPLGVQLSPTTQNLLYEVGSGVPGSDVAARALVTILTAGNNGAPATLSSAQAFVESFRGLLGVGVGMDPKFFNSLAAKQLADAVAAYNAFIDSSSPAYLASAPPALVAITAILSQLTKR